MSFPNASYTRLFGADHPEEVVSGVFSDELDKLGHREQVLDGWQLNTPRGRCFGRVRTVILETVETPDERIATGLGFLASLEPDDVLVVQGSPAFAYFGELMSRLAQSKGLAGVIIEGLTRDSFYTQTIDLPIFARGYSPRDIKGRGRVASVDTPVRVGHLELRPGDYVFGDADAVVVVPAAELDSLREPVRAAIAEEAEIKRLIAAGRSIEDILKIAKAF